MKKILVISPILFLMFSFRIGVKKEMVTGKVMHTGVFCGGAELLPEEYEKIAMPRPFPKQKLYVKAGKVNDLKAKPILEFISDTAGKFNFLLPPGDYCIVNQFKKDKKNYDSILKNNKVATQYYSAVDKKCLDQWFSTPDLIFTVKAGGENNILITFQEQCPWYNIPCVQYDGPLPP